jgi:hypothetical protein
MLSGVLKSKKAIEINIAIMRAFTLLRKAMLLNTDIAQKIRNIRIQLKEHDNKLLIIFDYLKQIEEAKQQQQDQSNRKRIGFRQDDQI